MSGEESAAAVRAERELSLLRHGMRTPLAIILGFAELLQGEGIDDETRRDYARRINDAGLEMRTLIDDARIE